jgi:hypothetical protein
MCRGISRQAWAVEKLACSFRLVEWAAPGAAVGPAETLAALSRAYVLNVLNVRCTCRPSRH